MLLLLHLGATLIRRLRPFLYGVQAWTQLHRITWLYCSDSVFLTNNEKEKDCTSEQHWFCARTLHCLSKLGVFRERERGRRRFLVMEFEVGFSSSIYRSRRRWLCVSHVTQMRVRGCRRSQDVLY